jgi:hypothetical protein
VPKSPENFVDVVGKYTMPVSFMSAPPLNILFRRGDVRVLVKEDSFQTLLIGATSGSSLRRR